MAGIAEELGWAIVPLDPLFVPSTDSINSALFHLTGALGERPTSWTEDHVQPIGLFAESDQPMTCPTCGKTTILQADEVFSLGEMLSIEPANAIHLDMKCCGSKVEVLSINFGDEPRFARFGIDANTRLDDRTLEAVSHLLGCPVTQLQSRE